MRLAVPCLSLFFWMGAAWAQTDCDASNGVLDTAQPKGMSVAELIQRFSAAENRIRDLRAHYTYTQDLMVQTLDGEKVTGQFHQVATISYDDKGKRQENVTYSEVPTLRDLQFTGTDMDDVRVFMPWIVTSDQVPEYNLTYAGQQHVDDLDTYVFHVEPKTQEKNKRYFQGRIWIDDRDLAVVKLCGKSVPEQVHPKKHGPVEIRPTFLGLRQLVDGNWFPAYARIDDTLHIGVQSVHVREIVKYTGYHAAGASSPATAPSVNPATKPSTPKN